MKPRRLGERLRALADGAWERGSRSIAADLHTSARAAEAERLTYGPTGATGPYVQDISLPKGKPLFGATGPRDTAVRIKDGDVIAVRVICEDCGDDDGPVEFFAETKVDGSTGYLELRAKDWPIIK